MSHRWSMAGLESERWSGLELRQVSHTPAAPVEAGRWESRVSSVSSMGKPATSQDEKQPLTPSGVPRNMRPQRASDHSHQLIKRRARKSRCFKMLAPLPWANKTGVLGERLPTTSQLVGAQLLSRVRHLVIPGTVPPDSSVHGILLAGMLEWNFLLLMAGAGTTA